MSVEPRHKDREIDPFTTDGAHRQQYFPPKDLQRFAEDSFTYKTPISIQPGKEGYPKEPVPLEIQVQIRFHTAVLLAWMHYFGQDYTWMLNPEVITHPDVQKFLQYATDVLGTRIQKGWERFHERNELAKKTGEPRHAADAANGYTGIIIGDVSYRVNSTLH